VKTVVLISSEEIDLVAKALLDYLENLISNDECVDTREIAVLEMIIKRLHSA